MDNYDRFFDEALIDNDNDSSIGSKIVSFTSRVGDICVTFIGGVFAASIITGFNLWCFANNKRPY